MEVANTLVCGQSPVLALGHAVTCGPRYRDEEIEADTCEEGRVVCSHTKALWRINRVIPGRKERED